MDIFKNIPTFVSRRWSLKQRTTATTDSKRAAFSQTYFVLINGLFLFKTLCYVYSLLPDYINLIQFMFQLTTKISDVVQKFAYQTKTLTDSLPISQSTWLSRRCHWNKLQFKFKTGLNVISTVASNVQKYILWLNPSKTTKRELRIHRTKQYFNYASTTTAMYLFKEI